MLYILENGVIRHTEDLAEWTLHFKHRKVANHPLVSTIFLGIDHSYGEGPPILFESLTVGGYMQRYCTLEEAVKGHKQLVKELTNETE